MQNYPLSLSRVIISRLVSLSERGTGDKSKPFRSSILPPAPLFDGNPLFYSLLYMSSKGTGQGGIRQLQLLIDMSLMIFQFDKPALPVPITPAE
jgi:hypothetical protein